MPPSGFASGVLRPGSVLLFLAVSAIRCTSSPLLAVTLVARPSSVVRTALWTHTSMSLHEAALGCLASSVLHRATALGTPASHATAATILALTAELVSGANFPPPVVCYAANLCQQHTLSTTEGHCANHILGSVVPSKHGDLVVALTAPSFSASPLCVPSKAALCHSTAVNCNHRCTLPRKFQYSSLHVCQYRCQCATCCFLSTSQPADLFLCHANCSALDTQCHESITARTLKRRCKACTCCLRASRAFRASSQNGYGTNDLLMK